MYTYIYRYRKYMLKNRLYGTNHANHNNGKYGVIYILSDFEIVIPISDRDEKVILIDVECVNIFIWQSPVSGR